MSKCRACGDKANFDCEICGCKIKHHCEDCHNEIVHDMIKNQNLRTFGGKGMRNLAYRQRCKLGKTTGG